MRGRTFKIRQVFGELRYALGNEMPANSQPQMLSHFALTPT